MDEPIPIHLDSYAKFSEKMLEMLIFRKICVAYWMSDVMSISNRLHITICCFSDVIEYLFPW